MPFGLAADRVQPVTEMTFVITRLVRVIQWGRPHEAGDDQHGLVRFSSRLTVPRSDGNRTFASEPGHTPLALAFLRDRGGLVSSPPKPVSEFAPTGQQQAREHADTARSGTRADG